jgi:GMP synthase (glutamine-hydrolysing)
MTDNIHKHRILILDFGSQYTQLVARRVRELGVYCELWAWDVTEAQIREFNPSGIILSGGPESTTEHNSPRAPQYVSKPVYRCLAFATVCRPWQCSWAAT